MIITICNIYWHAMCVCVYNPIFAVSSQQWHRRYFILLSTKVMEYYSSHECKPQDYLKSIDLSQCEDMIAPLPTSNRLHVIKLTVKNGAKLRHYYLDCSDEENMGSWVVSLAQTCGFCPGKEGEEGGS